MFQFCPDNIFGQASGQAAPEFGTTVVGSLSDDAFRCGRVTFISSRRRCSCTIARSID